MKASELREKSEAELREALEAELKEQFELRMQHAAGQLSQTSKMRDVRRNIARIHTVITELRNKEATA